MTSEGKPPREWEDDRPKGKPDQEDQRPKTKPIPGGTREFKEWVDKHPKPDPGDPRKGNQLPPDPRDDQPEPREPGTPQPQEA